MNYKEYAEKVKEIEISDKLKFKQAVMWLHPSTLPLGLVSVDSTDLKVIKVPSMAENSYGNVVPVIAIANTAFIGNETVTDIILPHSVDRLPKFAFCGCKNLRNITLSKSIKTIKEGTFSGCVNLENIYYEGTPEEWKRVNVVHEKHEIEFGSLIPGTPVHEISTEGMKHIPGNDAVFTANIHFGCDLECTDSYSLKLSVGGKDITPMFHTM